MNQRLFIWLFVAAIVAAPVLLFGIVKWHEKEYQQLPILGPEGHTIQNFRFSDQQGNAVTGENWDNRIVVAHLFFTRCPVACPKLIYQVKRVQAYGDKDILICSFSVDPQRDDVAALNAYSRKFDIRHNWSLLTGDKIDIYRFARKNLFIVATDGDGGPEDFIHSERLVLIDAEKRIRGYYKGTDEIEVNRLIHDIKKLKKERK